MNKHQSDLKKAHGNPAEFAQACYAAVPGAISMDEASEAIFKYQLEWGRCLHESTKIIDNAIFCNICNQVIAP